MKIRIIVPITDTQFNDGVKSEASSVAPPDMQIEVVNIQVGPASIESRFAEALAAPGILKLATEAQAQGFDGVFVDCFGEPAVSMVREKVDIPVVGGFEPAALLACLISRKFAIITVMPSVVPVIETLAKDLGVSGNITSVREVGIPVDELGDKDKLSRKLLEQARRAIRQEGAEAIVLGCTGMLDVAKQVEGWLKELHEPAPVIDPTTAAITMLEALVRNKLAQSRLTYFPPPPVKS